MVDNLTVDSSGSVDTGFVLALPFYEGDLQPDCVGVLTRRVGWGLMCGIKIPPQDFVLKMQGGTYAQGGGVFVGHYGILCLDDGEEGWGEGKLNHLNKLYRDDEGSEGVAPAFNC